MRCSTVGPLKCTTDDEYLVRAFESDCSPLRMKYPSRSAKAVKRIIELGIAQPQWHTISSIELVGQAGPDLLDSAPEFV